MNSGTESEFVQLNETRRSIYKAIEFLNDVSFLKRMRRLLMHYESSIRESFELTRHCPLQSRKLARILSGLTELVHTMSHGIQQDHVYVERMCNIVAYYISSELCAAQKQVESAESIVERIKMSIQTYVKQDTEHLLRTFVAIPMLFYRTDIVTELYVSFLFPQWDKNEKVAQAELADKVYIQYILIFYHWQSLVRGEAKREKIIQFADKFMRPSRTLALNEIYAEYLPKYGARSTATRYVLEHLKQTTSRNLHVASKVDNRMALAKGDEELTSDEELSVKVFRTPKLTYHLDQDVGSALTDLLGQVVESASTDQPTSLPSTNLVSFHSISPPVPDDQSVQTGEKVDLDSISTCILYSETQFPGTESFGLQLIYPAPSNFHSSSSSESMAKNESQGTETPKTVSCPSPLSSLETLKWQAGKKLLLSSKSPTSTSNPIDLRKLEQKALNYQCKRQKFVKLGKEHNKFYKDLLSLQRKNLRNLQEEQQLHLIRQATKRSRQLRALNDKRRCEAEQLEHQLAAIRK